MSEETCKAEQGRGRQAKEVEGEEGTQGRWKERNARKGGGCSGRLAREAEVEEGMQGRQRKRKARKSEQARGRHAR